ncbi:MAG: hypothetical protein U1C52_00645 [Patescibacteria group bacterium]|nr:hypothetical protein [Patescibacteria group bacterium]
MVEFSNILLLIVALFAFYLILRSILKVKFCVLCAAVATTWIGLLAASFYGVAVDSLSIGILMGGSAVGVMYLLEAKLPEGWSILKLPFLLTLFALIYVLLAKIPIDIKLSATLLALWAIFLTVFIFQSNGKLEDIGRKLIECCKNW